MPDDPIILAKTKSLSTYKIQNKEEVINLLSEALATPRIKTNDPHEGRDPRLKTTGIYQWFLTGAGRHPMGRE